MPGNIVYVVLMGSHGRLNFSTSPALLNHIHVHLSFYPPFWHLFDGFGWNEFQWVNYDYIQGKDVTHLLCLQHYTEWSCSPLSPIKLPSSRFRFVSWHRLEQCDVTGDQLTCPRVREGLDRYVKTTAVTFCTLILCCSQCDEIKTEGREMWTDVLWCLHCC